MELGRRLVEVQNRVLDYFRRRARKYGLQAANLRAEYILNWGGFVNASFTITDGQRTYHLKLADDEEMIYSLERWYDLRAPLENRYRAPKIIDWIEIEDSPFTGLLFERFNGRIANFLEDRLLHRQVLDLVTHLHHDPELTGALKAMDGEPGSCADYFISLYIDRFDEDLLAVARDLPPFVSLETLDWMQGETRHMEAMAREMASFELLAASPCHGDLWENNILLNDQGIWTVLDWDDLALGDPALEYSILLFRFWKPGGGEEVARMLPEQVQSDAALKERMDVCFQAYLLNEVIDTLADYVESEFAPEHQAEVKAEMERTHKEALHLYRQHYS